jgi:hypothetical protein
LLLENNTAVGVLLVTLPGLLNRRSPRVLSVIDL